MDSGVSCQLQAQRLGPPKVCYFRISFHFCGHPILTIQVPLFFSPFLPVLSTGKLLRGLIRSCFWDCFPWQLRVGFWVLSKLSEVKDYCTLFILNFQSVMDWYFCKILKKKLNYEKSDIKNKDIQNTNLIFFLMLNIPNITLLYYYKRVLKCFLPISALILLEMGNNFSHTAWSWSPEASLGF